MNRLDKSGYTMAETLVGFTLLAILMVSFVGIIRFASNMQMEADDRIRAKEYFEQEYYKTDAIKRALEGTSTELKADITGEAVFEEIDASGETVGNEIRLDADVISITDKSGEYGYRFYRIWHTRAGS